MNFLTEHGIGSYGELVERGDSVAAASIRTRESLRDTEQRIADLALLGKQIDTYRKLKPVYDRYKASKDKEKFLRGFESDVILFEAAAREIKKAGLTKLPSAEKLKAELDGLTARKTALQAELRKKQREEKEYDTMQKNIDIFQPVEKVQRKLGFFACIRYNGSGGEKDAETRKNGSGCSGDRGDRQPGAKGAPAAEDR